jgi:putative FmdB family regulatory protein
MPTYEYACTKCGQHVEVFQRLSEAPLSTCGVCGGPLRKVFHPAGIVFKGSGFYATDSRSKPKERGGTAKDGDKKPGKEPATGAAASSGSSTSSSGSSGSSDPSGSPGSSSGSSDSAAAAGEKAS